MNLVVLSVVDFIGHPYKYDFIELKIVPALEFDIYLDNYSRDILDNLDYEIHTFRKQSTFGALSVVDFIEHPI